MSQPSDCTVQGRKREKRQQEQLSEVVETVDNFLELVEQEPRLWFRPEMEGVRNFCSHWYNHPDLYPLNLPHENQRPTVAENQSTNRSMLTKEVARHISSHQNPYEGAPLNKKPVVQVTVKSEKRRQYSGRVFVQHTWDVVDGDNKVSHLASA